jgi:hypothetical protein
LSTLKVNKIVGLTSPLVVVPTQAMNVTSVTLAESPYDIEVEDGFIVINSAGGGVVLNLPSPVNLIGSWYVLKDGSGNCSSLNPITINAPGGTTIDKGASLSVETPFTAVSIVSDGTEWFVF